MLEVGWATAQVRRFLVLAIAAIFGPRGLLIAENLCLRQQLLVLQRRHPRPRLSKADWRFWILASRWLGGWRNSLLIVKPETVLSWQRLGWRAYWTWRSSRRARGVARRSRGNFKLSSGACPRKMLCGAKSGSKPSWQGWGSRFPPEPWRSICVSGTTGAQAPVGESS